VFLGRNQKDINQAEEIQSTEVAKEKKGKFNKSSGAATAPEQSSSDEEDNPEEVMMMQIPWMQA
jgi:hypothetical protein